MFQYDLGLLPITLYCFANKEKKRTGRLEVSVVFRLVIFLFNQSKNNAVLLPRIGHFRELQVFEAKNLSFEAKTKDLKMCPRGEERPRRIHFSHLRYLFLGTCTRLIKPFSRHFQVQNAGLKYTFGILLEKQ